MKLRELLYVFNSRTVLDISAIDGKHCKTFSCKIIDLPKKYLDYYVGYACPETMLASYCSQKFETENNHACLLLDIYKDELEAEHSIQGQP